MEKSWKQESISKWSLYFAHYHQFLLSCDIHIFFPPPRGVDGASFPTPLHLTPHISGSALPRSKIELFVSARPAPMSIFCLARFLEIPRPVNFFVPFQTCSGKNTEKFISKEKLFSIKNFHSISYFFRIFENLSS